MYRTKHSGYNRKNNLSLQFLPECNSVDNVAETDKINDEEV